MQEEDGLGASPPGSAPPGYIRAMPRRWGGALLIAAAIAARAQEVPAHCPVDGASLSVPPGGAWNAAGGVDSDGCTYAVDAGGRWRIPTLEEVVACARCGGAWRVQDLGLRLTQAEGDAVRGALAAAQSGFSWHPVAARHERAAASYAALGSDRRPAPHLAAEMLLRAAWAVRGEAVLGDAPDGSYRPRDPAEARAGLSELRARQGQGGRRSRIEAMQLALERTREELQACAPAGPTAALARQRARQALEQLEQELCALRSDLAPEAPEPERDLLVALARAASRLGDPVERDRWLSVARSRLGERVAQRLAALERAWTEESRLLALAGGELLRGAEATSDPREQARLLYLAGDCARRRGEPEKAWREPFERARKLDPDGRTGRWAGLLLGR